MSEIRGVFQKIDMNKTQDCSHNLNWLTAFGDYIHQCRACGGLVEVIIPDDKDEPIIINLCEDLTHHIQKYNEGDYLV